MKCADCGAEIPQGGSICDYCGSSAPVAQGLQDSSPGVNRAATFARIKASPLYMARNLADTMSSLPGLGIAAIVVPVVFLVIWIGAAGFMGMMAISHGAPVIFGFVPGGFVVLGIIMLITVIGKAVSFSATAPSARPAIVSGKRTEVSGGSGDSSASTSYHATFEFENGERAELTVDPRLYAELMENDAGILYSRVDWAVKFQRV